MGSRMTARGGLVGAALVVAALAAGPTAAQSPVAGLQGDPNFLNQPPVQSLPTYDGEGTVGFSIYNGGVPHWNLFDIPDLEACLANWAPGVDLITQDPKGDAATQTTQVQSMLTQGIDVLLVTPAALSPTAIINAAKQDGVPVIVYLNPPTELAERDVVALVGDGPVPVGIAQGQWIIDNVPAGSKIALINGDLATQYAVLMREGQLSVLQPKIDDGTYTLVGDKGATNWNPSNAGDEAAAILTSHPDVAAFIAGYDGIAGAIIERIRSAGIEDGEVKIIGLDADPIGAQNIMLGTQAATVIKSSHAEAAVACAAIIYTLRGEPFPADLFPDTWDFQTAPIPFRDTPVEVVDKSSITKAIDWGIITQEQVCEGVPASAGAPCG